VARTQQEKRWRLEPPHPQAEELAGRLKVSPILAQILLNRGISNPADCAEFLRPNLKLLHDPSIVGGLPQAAERIARAIRDREKIVIYGDYDVDGITATAILWHAIRLLGGEVDFYIPHRLEEGYGLNPEAIGQICDEGAKLIITVDCGVTAIEPAAVARDRGVDLIVTDHHEWRERLPLPPGEGGGEGSEMSDLRLGISDLKPETSNLQPLTPTLSQREREPEAVLPQCHAIVHPRLPGHDPCYPNP
jgi:single-stranded-DNA-specific exonuclease